MKKDDNRSISNRFTYVITFLLGLAFSLTLVQSAWKTAIERKQKDFHFDILSIKQAVTRNVLTGNDATNNIAAFMYSNDDIHPEQFQSFAKDILERYRHIQAVNYYTYSGNENVYGFPLKYQYSREENTMHVGEDVYVNPQVRDAIDTSIETGSVVPAPPDVENDPERKYWLFKAIQEKTPSSVKNKDHAGHIKGIVSVLVSPVKLLGDTGSKSSLAITMYSDTSNLYGRQLLYFNNPHTDDAGKFWKLDTLKDEELIQLPPYSIKIIIQKDLYVTDLEYHLVFVAMLIGLGIIMLLFGLVRAKSQQEKELRIRNKVIEQKVEEQTHELAIARDEALEAARMKSEFLASMSHEIRTPLNAIIGMSDLMSETQLTEEQGRYVGVFKKAGDALLSLVNDILDLSKIEANQLILESIPFNVMEVIEEVADIYALKAADKNIEIITHIDTNINVNRIGDPGRLKQIILNLISNALKFTDEGEIVISLKDESDKQDDNHLVICVKDTGIGIAQDKLESIFSSFSQADASTTRKYGGTGLGLTISKRLTAMMNGSIWVESKEGEGSLFYVRIALPEQTQRSVIKQDILQKNILIVESRISNCLNIEDQLIAAGAKCFRATNPDEALKNLENHMNIDVVLLESRLLFSEDVKLKNALSDISLFKQTILLVNPKDISKHSVMAREFGINHMLMKPVKRRELYHSIKNVINKSQITLHEENENENNDKVVAARHILLVEDNPDNRMLIRAYLKKTPHTVDEAENGALAVEMFKKTDYDLVFMDVQMPVMDGHEATRLIRAWEKEQDKKRTNIIALTAHAIKEEIDKCIAAGCDTHISKPVKKATLIQTIEELE